MRPSKKVKSSNAVHCRFFLLPPSMLIWPSCEQSFKHFSLLVIKLTFLDLLPLVLRPGKQSAVLYHMFVWQMTTLLNICLKSLIILIPVTIIFLISFASNFEKIEWQSTPCDISSKHISESWVYQFKNMVRVLSLFILANQAAKPNRIAKINLWATQWIQHKKRGPAKRSSSLIILYLFFGESYSKDGFSNACRDLMPHRSGA